MQAETADTLRIVYQQLIDENGLPVWRLPFGIAYDTGLDLAVVQEILQNDSNILASHLTVVGKRAYTLRPDAIALA